MNSTPNFRPPIDVGRMLDEGSFGPLQKMIVILAALAVVMDGFDSQLIGYAIPSIIKDWNITRGAFAPALAVGLIGMGVGSALAGLYADRFGRRMAVVGSVFLFGAATCLIGFSPDVTTIAILRFFAGLGIGGALPSATTMTAEFTPVRRRALAITATIVCYPIGGMIAGLFASAVLPSYGWRGLFWIGGLLPMGLSVVLYFALPESARFLSRHPLRWPELNALLARMGRSVAPDAVFVDAAEQKHETRAGVRALFATGRTRDTLALWLAFFMCLLAVFTAASWLPAMLAAEGLPSVVAGSGLTAYNLGGAIGALLCAMTITRIGSRWPLVICCAGAAVSAFLLQRVSPAQETTLFILGIGIHGLFANAVQSTLYALTAHVYPTLIRATGTAASLAIGRLGAVLSAFVGAAVISAGGATPYLTLLGSAMAAAGVALWVVRKHIPARVAAAESAKTELAH